MRLTLSRCAAMRRFGRCASLTRGNTCRKRGGALWRRSCGTLCSAALHWRCAALFNECWYDNARARARRADSGAALKVHLV